MSNSKKFTKRASIAGVGALAMVVGGLSMSAGATSVSLPVYDETDSPNPVTVVGGLAFYKAADMAWFIGETGVGFPLSEVDGLAYTVEDSTSFAPSYQLVAFADRDGAAHKYTRLVFEPYMQDTDLNDNEGVYTDVEDGQWWTSKIASGPGSQADPQPLSFFENGGAAGWDNVNVFAVAVHQGTTSDVTSIVSSVTYDGTEIAIGKQDTTPFDAADVKSAANLAVAEYTTTHHNKDNTNIGDSRVQLVGSAVAGKTLTANLWGSINTKATNVKYQWYVGGKVVANATKDSFKVTSAHKGKSISLKVTGTYKYVVFSVHSNTLTAK